MARWLVLLAFAAAFLLAPLALAAGTGTIDGHVTQGTAGGGSVAGLAVRLLEFKGSEKADEQQATTDANGAYHFDVDPAADRVYFPVVEYKDIPYYPMPLAFKDGATSQTGDITVYEPTTSDEQVGFARANIVVTGVEPRRLYLMEMGSVQNAGDRVYIAPETLHFDLPKGAENFAPQAGFMSNAVSQRPDGFVLTSPVLPGNHEVAYAYELPTDGAEADLSRRLEHPVGTFQLFLPRDGSVTVESPQLQPAGTRDMGGQTYLVYSASSLPKGATLELRVGGLPAEPGALVRRAGYGLLAVGGLGLLVMLFLAWRRGLRADPTPVSGAGSPEARRDQLLHGMAELDERYESGALGEAEYRRARDIHKRRLVALVRETGLPESRYTPEANGVAVEDESAVSASPSAAARETQPATDREPLPGV